MSETILSPSFVGSSWGIWDLQVQTILDDGYEELSNYYEQLKSEDVTKWNSFAEQVGGEANALKFDSKAYFCDSSVSKEQRRQDYGRNLLAFLTVYRPLLRCVALTDHNYDDQFLLDCLVAMQNGSSCRFLSGVEINASGVHMLALFGKPPFDKNSFSDGISSFLDAIDVRQRKRDGILTVSPKSQFDVFDIIRNQQGICIFPHCNSSNGLFQERGKTDRTHLADVFNHANPIVLQACNKRSIDSVFEYIAQNGRFLSTPIPTLCSDSRSLRGIGIPDQDGNYCWIKAEPTFEGLRQATFEPQARIHIDKNPPIDPPHRIAKVEWDFPESTKIDGDEFCLTGKNVVRLSPNYTCFIGGRGTGKSAILNLINEKLNPSSKGFYGDHMLTDQDNKALIIKNLVRIDDDKEQVAIEFVSQNEVEQFASDSKEFTQAIYRRLQKKGGSRLELLERTLRSRLAEVDAHMNSMKLRVHLQQSLEQKERELETNKRIVDSLQSPEYVSLSESISTLTESIEKSTESKVRFEALLASLKQLVLLYPKTDVISTNPYDVAYNREVDELAEIVRRTASVDFSGANGEIDRLRDQLRTSKDAMKLFLRGEDLTEDNIQDVTNASERNAVIEKEIADVEREISSLDGAIGGFDLGDVETAKAEYETALMAELRQVTAELKNVNMHVKSIELVLSFDEESAMAQLYQRFKTHFGVDVPAIKTKENALADTLFRQNPFELVDRDTFLSHLTKTEGGKEGSQAQRFLTTVFGDPDNFDQYKLLAKSIHLNQLDFRLIDVLYDNRPLAHSSFGQRCTAALVILLSLGNSPIVIDEPEAHLDSLLIANYLVDLVKISKRHRQIIFATHNANLVVNGDADLIYHLAIDANKKTMITSTTIENLALRELLVGLEGGEEAFRRRENKYYQT